MKVLSVNTNDSYGGAARAAYRIHQGVRSLGVDSCMLVRNKGTKDEHVHALAEYTPENVLYTAWDWCDNKLKNQKQHFQWQPYLQTKQEFFLSDLRGENFHNALQKIDYDVLHLHWLNNRFMDIHELAKIHKPIVWTLHDSWPFCGVCHVPLDCNRYTHHCGICPMLGSNIERDLAYEVFEQKQDIYRNLDLHIVTPSRWLGECVKHSALLGRFPIMVIPNGLDTELYRVLQKEEMPLRRNTDKPIILYGAVNAAKDKIKGFQTLLTALRILDSQGREAQLVVFGAEPQELPMQFKHIDVQFVGYVRDAQALTKLYNLADVMVVPSYSEVFGQTASEAMACGTPVVAFRCTGIQEVVEDGCGYLAEPYSADDLASGIRYCIENNSNNVLGKAARASIVRRYAMDVVAEQYKSLYKSLITDN